MPMSIDPPLEENEVECARCGARVYYELTRCPNCGVNLYEPDDEQEPEMEQSRGLEGATRRSWLVGFKERLRGWLGRSHPAEALFAASQAHAALYSELLHKVGGDHATVERLIRYEKSHLPEGSRTQWLQNAIRRWERDNR